MTIMDKDDYMYMEMLKMIFNKGISSFPSTDQLKEAADAVHRYRRIISESRSTSGSIRPVDLIKGNQ